MSQAKYRPDSAWLQDSRPPGQAAKEGSGAKSWKGSLRPGELVGPGAHLIVTEPVRAQQPAAQPAVGR